MHFNVSVGKGLGTPREIERQRCVCVCVCGVGRIQLTRVWCASAALIYNWNIYKGNKSDMFYLSPCMKFLVCVETILLLIALSWNGCFLLVDKVQLPRASATVFLVLDCLLFDLLSAAGCRHRSVGCCTLAIYWPYLILDIVDGALVFFFFLLFLAFFTCQMEQYTASISSVGRFTDGCRKWRFASKEKKKIPTAAVYTQLGSIPFFYYYYYYSDR